MNISLDSVFALAYSSAANLNDIEVGDHDPQQRGFNARNTELAFDGAVDPYFQGFANIVFLLDNDNQTEVELEEAFLQTSSLPYNLQLKGGQFFADFGRLNPTHPHTWDFADSPLVNGLFLGPTGCAASARKLPGRCLCRGIRNWSSHRKTDAVRRDFHSGILVTTECFSIG